MRSQGDLHAVLFVHCGPQLLVVGLLLKQVPDQPLLLAQTPAAWEGGGQGPREDAALRSCWACSGTPGGQLLQGKWLLWEWGGEPDAEEGVLGQRRREETVQWGRLGRVMAILPTPTRAASSPTVNTDPSIPPSEWVLGLSSGRLGVWECQGDRCRVGAWGVQRKEAAGKCNLTP